MFLQEEFDKAAAAAAVEAVTLLVGVLPLRESDKDIVQSAIRQHVGPVVAKLQQWISDCQSKMYVNCGYCGHRYGPDDGGTPVNQAELLKNHIEQCPAHPMALLKQQYNELAGKYVGLLNHATGSVRGVAEAAAVSLSAIDAAIELAAVDVATSFLGSAHVQPAHVADVAASIRGHIKPNVDTLQTSLILRAQTAELGRDRLQRETQELKIELSDLRHRVEDIMRLSTDK